MIKTSGKCINQTTGFLAIFRYLLSWSESKSITPTTRVQTYIYFLPFSFLIGLLSLNAFFPFISLYFIPYLIYYFYR